MDTPEPTLFQLSYKTDDPRLRQLAESYWASYRDPDGTLRWKYNVVKDLAPRFGLRRTAASVTGPVMDAATAFYGTCPRCQREMEYVHRTDFEQNRRDFKSGKPCERCQEEEKRARTAARRKAIRRAYSVQPGAIDTSRMTLRNAVYSLAVLRANSFSGSRHLSASWSFRPRLSPSATFDREILMHLYGRKIISVDPNSDERGFGFNQRGEAEWYYPIHVRWRWRDLDPSRFAKRVGDLIGRKTFPPDWAADVTDLSRDIASYECVGLFQSLDNHHRLQWELPKGWESVILRGLEFCPVGQMMPLIPAALKATCDEIEWTRRTPQLCGKTWVAKFEGLLEQVRREPKLAGPSERYSDCPRSAVSIVLYDMLLHAGDDGYTKLAAGFSLPEEKPTPPPPPFVPVNEELIRKAIAWSRRDQDRSTPVSSLLVFLTGLSASDRAQVAAVMLVGRGDEDAEDFDYVVHECTRPLDCWSQSEYLAGKRRLWKSLESGLDALLGTMTH